MNMDEQDGQDGTSRRERSGHPVTPGFILCILFLSVLKKSVHVKKQ
jgi:hypothetical protein